MRVFEIAGSLAFISVVLGAATPCRADITYAVNLTVGTATVVGDIVTDGAIGVLKHVGGGATPAPDIRTWNLVVTSTTEVCTQSTPGGPYNVGAPSAPFNSSSPTFAPCSSDLVGPYLPTSNPAQLVFNSGVDLSATSTQLLFNFSGTDRGFLLFETGASAALCFESAAGCVAGAPGAGESLYVGSVIAGDHESTSLSGLQIIGTATPEPSYWALLSVGLLGMIGVFRLRRDRVKVPVSPQS